MQSRSDVTADDISRMRYMKACVKESFRMVFPVEGGPARILVKDIELQGYKIPKNVHSNTSFDTGILNLVVTVSMQLLF